MQPQENNRILAVGLATMLRREVVVYEGPFPWVAHPIPVLYSLDRHYAVEMAKELKLISYLPIREQIWMDIKALPGKVLGAFRWVGGLFQ